MATLYGLAEAEQQLISMFTVDDIDEKTLNDTLEGLDIGGKLEDYCMVIRQLEADQKTFKEEADYFATKAKRAENGVKRLKSGILNYMQRTNKSKAEAGLFKISTRESKAVNIFDEAQIPAQFLIPQPPKIDKTAIKKAINGGEEVTGATIQTNTNLQIK